MTASTEKYTNAMAESLRSIVCGTEKRTVARMISEEMIDRMDGAVSWSDCDDAVIGTGSRCGSPDVFVYDYEKLIQVFVEQGMDYEEAVEWVDYNILGAYVGDTTPIIMFGIGDE